MNKRFSTSLFIFRRDLRLFDNTGLITALAQSERVFVCFIFDPVQIESHPYQSQPGLQFMLESLEDLRCQLFEHDGQLHLFYAKPSDVLKQLHRQYAIDAVFVNRDYTPFSRQRDSELQRICKERAIAFHSIGDALLNEPENVLKDDGQAYRVFTAFYHRALQTPVEMPQALPHGHLMRCATGNSHLIDRFKRAHYNPFRGGRRYALSQLNALENCRNYAEERDIPVALSTSHLSAYLKFGCCSIREAYYAIVTALSQEHSLLRQLYWRDFFTHVAFHFPQVFGQAFQQRYDAIVWRNDQNEFQAWIEGRTGFPIVDAGMRELKQTGLMHNRVRMINASFLVKDLQIDWRWGERYFAQHLLDYDPCLNNGNWQWVASTGCDAQPYFRIFNPWLQQKKFDKDCLYIKRWLPELRSFSSAHIHHCDKKALNDNYPRPIVEHALRSQQTKQNFRRVSQN